MLHTHNLRHEPAFEFIRIEANDREPPIVLMGQAQDFPENRESLEDM
jgi:hypothetical protein